MMEKQIIFLDIDGTLTEPGHNIPPESALLAIRAAQRKGHLVYLCTGRNYDMMSPLLEFGFDGFIASSGGYIQCGEEVIYDCPLTESQRVQALGLFEKNHIFRTIECKEGSYTDAGFKEFLKKNAKSSGNSEFLRWREQLEKNLNIRPIEEYGNQAVYKVVLMVDEEWKLEEPMAVLGDEFQFVIQEKNSQGYINCEFISKQYDKGQAVKKVCEHLGISIENTFAFGDSMNDLEMMEIANISICMENGSSALKEMADEICPAVTEDGLHKAFAKHGLL